MFPAVKTTQTNNFLLEMNHRLVSEPFDGWRKNITADLVSMKNLSDVGFADLSDSSLRPVEGLHQDLVGGWYRPGERELRTCWTTRRWLRDLTGWVGWAAVELLWWQTGVCEGESLKQDDWRSGWLTGRLSNRRARRTAQFRGAS